MSEYESFKRETEMDTEEARKADFKACPILADYLATMLQDLDYSEADEACTEDREPRDAGTIYDLCEETYQKHKADCERFYRENLADIEAACELVPGEEGLRYSGGRYITMERIGSTFYMLRVGHGVAFTDDGNADCLERLNEATRKFGGFDAYFGDDDHVYTM
jgi:hypothetical protein